VGREYVPCAGRGCPLLDVVGCRVGSHRSLPMKQERKVNNSTVESTNIGYLQVEKKSIIGCEMGGIGGRSGRYCLIIMKHRQ